MTLSEKLKKLIRDSNPMSHKQTFVEKCLSGSCYKVRENLDIIIDNNPSENTLRIELGLTDDEYKFMMEAEDYYEAFQSILLDRTMIKRH